MPWRPYTPVPPMMPISHTGSASDAMRAARGVKTNTNRASGTLDARASHSLRHRCRNDTETDTDMYSTIGNNKQTTPRAVGAGLSGLVLSPRRDQQDGLAALASPRGCVVR